MPALTFLIKSNHHGLLSSVLRVADNTLWPLLLQVKLSYNANITIHQSRLAGPLTADKSIAD